MEGHWIHLPPASMHKNRPLYKVFKKVTLVIRGISDDVHVIAVHIENGDVLGCSWTH
jgi:hypothetical protein